MLLLEARYWVNLCKTKHKSLANRYRYLIAIAHEVVGGDECLVDDHPAGVLGSLDQQVRQRWDRHIGLVGAVQQVCKQLIVLWKESGNISVQEFEPLKT